ncbi:hypothetical protein C7B80_26670 [Cyanosarcina cf. burmensis CCALA 770]|nr:hypothetical protein C7B80_26670 [Cyanosarcina cf. burmensis CCALA 770]
MNIVFHAVGEMPVGQRDSDGYINLNQLAASANKRLDNWLANKSTKELIAEFERQQKLPGIPGSLFEPALITVEGRNGATWAHPDIAIQFAQWCSPTFALQVSRWVREWLRSSKSNERIIGEFRAEDLEDLKAVISSALAISRSIHSLVHNQVDVLKDGVRQSSTDLIDKPRAEELTITPFNSPTPEAHFPTSRLMSRYVLGKQALYNRLGFLKIKPTKIGGRSYITLDELELCDRLHRHISSSKTMIGFIC